MSTDATTPAQDTLSSPFAAEGDLGLMLCEHIWDKDDPLHLGGEDFEVVGSDEVPGYEDEAYAVLLRRTSDSRVFEAEIDVTIHPALTVAQREERKARLIGQRRLPGMES